MDSMRRDLLARDLDEVLHQVAVQEWQQKLQSLHRTALVVHLHGLHVILRSAVLVTHLGGLRNEPRLSRLIDRPLLTALTTKPLGEPSLVPIHGRGSATV